MKKYLRWFGIAVVVLFVAVQFFRPDRTNPSADQALAVGVQSGITPPVANLIKTSCYDCHSNETRWPWYSHVAPVSWLVADDVKDGRERLNFSDWPRALPERAAKRLERMSEELGYKDMPPAKYTIIHADARLTDDQRKQLIAWADQEAEKLKAAVAGK